MSEPDYLPEEENEGADPAGRGVFNAMIIFLVLFLFAAGLLAYYQFYQGHGKWRFTLLHKANDTTFLSEVKKCIPDTVKTKQDTLKITVHDTVQAPADTMQHVSAPIELPKNDIAEKPERKLKNIEEVDPIPEGIYYEVQIGTFENYKLKKYDAVFNRLHEEKSGKLTKLTLGRFKTLDAANRFKKDMVKLGVKSAWVVKKAHGVRVK